MAYTDFDRATSSVFWSLGLTTKYLTEDMPWLPGVELTAWGLEQGVVGRLPLGLLPVEELPDRLSPSVLGVPLKYSKYDGLVNLIISTKTKDYHFYNMDDILSK